jgi:hypothetical protein
MESLAASCESQIGQLRGQVDSQEEQLQSVCAQTKAEITQDLQEQLDAQKTFVLQSTSRGSAHRETL